MSKLTKVRLGALALALTVSACGSEGRVEFLSVGTAGTGGLYYPLGGAIASRLSLADSTRQFTAEVSGGSVENINRLQSGQMDLAMVIGMTAYQAWRGEGDYAGSPVPGVRAVAPLYANLTHILVPAGSRAQSVGDFAGFRVSVGAAGSGTEVLARHILAAYGLTYDDIEPRYLSFAESSSALMDGSIDAAIISVGYPAAAVLEATTTAPMRLLPTEPEVMEAILAEHPYYSAGVIPPGSYRGQTDPIPSVAVMNWIVAMDTLDDDVVTLVLNVMQDDRAALEQVHDMAKQIDLRLLARPPVPLHPAAERWFETSYRGPR